MISPLVAIDNLIAPIVTAANRVRQARDALPVALWQLVPDPIRAPLDVLFSAVEAYDRKVGQLKDLGLMTPPDPG